MSDLWYELRTAACTELFHLILWIAPKDCVFTTVVSQSVHDLMNRLLDLESKGWMCGKAKRS